MAVSLEEGLWYSMSIKISPSLKPLGRTLTPYFAQTVIFGVITVFMLLVAYKRSQWALACVPITIWAGYAILVSLGLRYRVFWDSNGVVLRASGIGERRIAYDSMSEVKMERANANELMTQARPFRRIVIHGDVQHQPTFIDISLRHFAPRDIDELLAEIRVRRPDLTIPQVAWGKGSL